MTDGAKRDASSLGSSTFESGLLPMLPNPPELEKQLLEMQIQAPYCGLGFEKSRLPADVHQQILDHYRANVSNFRPEHPISEIETINEKMIPAVYLQDEDFNAQLSRKLQPMLEDWSSMALCHSACYGVRVYQRGTYLYSHVDRTETHIISAAVCVDHSLDSRWPLFIEDIDGKPHQVDLEPGELVFYEGARLRHGRPYPLDGDYYAGIFVHYVPRDPIVAGAPAR